MSTLKETHSASGQATTETVDVNGTTVVRDVSPKGTIAVPPPRDGEAE